MKHTHTIKLSTGKEIVLTDEEYKRWVRNGSRIQNEVLKKWEGRAVLPPVSQLIGYDWDKCVDDHNAFIKEFNQTTKDYLEDEDTLSSVLCR